MWCSIWCVWQLISSCLLLFLLVQLIRLAFSDCDLFLSLYARNGRNLCKLRGKVCWITGASSGIGEDLAYYLAELGAKLILSARREKELQRVLEKCIALSPAEFKSSHKVLRLDILDYEQHAALVDEVMEEYGRIDYLVNNAGRSQRAEAIKTDLEVDKAIIDLNTIGTISLTKAALPYLVKQKSGAIVVISSIAGKLGAPGAASYSASKHALQGFFNTLRIEISDTGVKVLTVCPGPVVSNILSDVFTTHVDKKPKEIENQMKLNHTKMPTRRCSYLTAVAMANNISEVWICGQPILLFTYMIQYLPLVAFWIGNKIGLRRLQAVRDGKDEIDSFFKKNQ